MAKVTTSHIANEIKVNIKLNSTHLGVTTTAGWLDNFQGVMKRDHQIVFQREMPR
jgi:hypothetical protein